MKVYTTEEEQVQALVNWFKAYGLYLFIVLLVVLSAIFGWQYWKSSNENYLSSASEIYEKMQSADKDSEKNDFAADLLKNYKSTVYGKIAGLYFANKKVKTNSWADAEKEYEWIYKETSTWPDLQVVVFENLVRSKLELKKFDEAFSSLIKAEKETNFVTLYPLNIFNLKGDILHKLNKNQEAVEAYNKALDFARENPEMQQQTGQFVNWVTLKRNDLLKAKPIG